jgi:AraC-like DNA-binding protein
LGNDGEALVLDFGMTRTCVHRRDATARGLRTARREPLGPMIATTRVDSPLGCWTLTDYVPAAGDRLGDVLQRVWLFNGATTLPRERIFPDGTLEIVLQLDAQYRLVSDGPGELFSPLSVGGMRTTAMTIEGSGRPVRVLGMRLRPTGAFALLRTSLHPLTGLDLDLHDVIGRAAAELGERCATAQNDAACVVASVDWARAHIARAPEPAPRVARAVAQIEANGGDVAIAGLDALGGASRARFVAAFRDHVGVTPKRFARIVRFRRALELLHAGDAPLGAIAAQVGYYDQPHMNAEFRIHAGMTPQALRRAERYPNSTSLPEQFFQDDGESSAIESVYG